MDRNTLAEYVQTATELLQHPWSVAIAVVVIGLPAVWILTSLVRGVLTRRLSPHAGMVGKTLVFYVLLFIWLMIFLSELGVDVTTLVATAGIGAVAIGFAAQTSLANVISGVFLVSEKPFQVGDLVRIDGTLGVILSIDPLSVKMRTLDNLFVRIPNEAIIKTQVTNVTRFPIRRLDVTIGVAYKEDPQRVMKVLREIARDNRYCLDEPEPLLIFKDFNTSSIDFMLGVWFEKSKFLDVKNSICCEIKARFDAEGIEIPFPHLTVYTGAETSPFPVRLDPAESGDAAAKTPS